MVASLKGQEAKTEGTAGLQTGIARERETSADDSAPTRWGHSHWNRSPKAGEIYSPTTRPNMNPPTSPWSQVPA